jgi:hypothetical protein
LPKSFTFSGGMVEGISGVQTGPTAFFFLLLAGISALLMRLQLAQPESKLIGPDLYDQLFTMHGTTMMFLFAETARTGPCRKRRRSFVVRMRNEKAGGR